MRDSFRTERDTMGDMQVPTSALYGPQTARAVHNFPISGTRFPRSFIRALGMIKSAAAIVNGRMGRLPAESGGIYPNCGRTGCGRAVRRSVPDRHLPDRQRHFHEHECQ